MNLLAKELHKIGCQTVIDHSSNDYYIDMVMGLPSLGLRVMGIVGENADVVMSHIAGRSDEEVQKVINAVTKVTGRGPMIRMTYPVSEEYAELGSIAGFTEGASDNIVYDYWMWDRLNPDACLRRMLNDPRDPLYEEYLQGTLLEGRQMATYIDAQLTQRYREAARMHELYAGIYGLDPVFLDCPDIEDSDDFRLFITYTSMLLGPKEKSNNLACDYVKRYICQREQIGICEPRADRRLEVDDDFQTWLDYYETYYQRQTLEWRGRLYDAYLQGEDLSAFAPSGDWRSAK